MGGGKFCELMVGEEVGRQQFKGVCSLMLLLDFRDFRYRLDL